MKGDMMQNGQCPMMQDGKMMETMQKNMKKNCQKMAKDCQSMKDGDMAKDCQEMTKTCHSMMKDMKMMADMHKNMMKNSPMMQGGGMMPNQSTESQPAATSADTSAVDHAKHHPQ